MIVGIGIDVVEVNRIAESIKREGFLSRVFTSTEQEECHKSRNFAERFAGRFAVKEAFMKAVGAGLRQGVWFRQLEVLNETTGRPYLKVTGRAAEIMHHLGATAVHVSISHTAGVAAGVVILEGSVSP